VPRSVSHALGSGQLVHTHVGADIWRKVMAACKLSCYRWGSVTIYMYVTVSLWLAYRAYRWFYTRNMYDICIKLLSRCTSNESKRQLMRSIEVHAVTRKTLIPAKQLKCNEVRDAITKQIFSSRKTYFCSTKFQWLQRCGFLHKYRVANTTAAELHPVWTFWTSQHHIPAAVVFATLS